MKILRKLAAVIVVAGLLAGAAVPACAMTFFYGETPLDLRIDALKEMIEEVRENYKDETEMDDIFFGIYQGLFSGLGDPWSEYVITEEPAPGTNFVTTDVDEVYEGIGIVIRQTTSGLRISSVVSGSPAYQCGIRSGDYILKVGPQDVTEMTSEEAAQLIRGSSGSTVTLTVDRDGEVKVFEVVRQVIRTDTVRAEMLADNIGYIKITSFSAGTADAFAEEYDKLAAEGAKGIVLDLRGNGGGSVEQAVSVADHLIHKDGVISIFKRQGEVIETVHSTADSFAQLPVVCLVDGKTASASELVVAALKDHKAATIAGETTYGKGVAQFVGSGGKGNYFKLSVYYFLSPKGYDIDGVGIQPDVTVYNQSERSEEEIAAIRANLAPVNEEKKYYAGQNGLNVYGVQQRLQAMGYDVEPTSVMDAKTIAALKLLQAEAGACPYGGLDYCTLGIVKDKFDAWCSPASEDAALAKAIELLK
jgi:carboxyl-terminal processing protease